MPRFNLSEDAMARLRAKFEEFQRDRKLLREILADYAAEYRQLTGTTQERQARLRQKYAGRTPRFSHLVWSEEDGLCWSVADIATVLGRERSTITRTLAAMTEDRRWRARLLALRKDAVNGNGAPVQLYQQDVFWLIVDHYEEEYLLRFSEPRKGSPENAPDSREVRRFWEYLGAAAEAQALELNVDEGDEDEEERDAAGLPPLSWWEILSLIWSKVFTVKTGTVFTLLFVAAWELARRFPALAPWLAATPAAVLLTCAVLIRRGRGSPARLSGLGAGALLFGMLWLTGLLSSHGASSGGEKIAPDEAPSLRLGAVIALNGIVSFRVVTDAKDAKNFLFRLSPDVEYRPVIWGEHPLIHIPVERQRETVYLDVKYVDLKDREHGPWSFNFDLDKVRFEADKQASLAKGEEMGGWLAVYRIGGTTDVDCIARLGRSVEWVLYGVNKETPDQRILADDLRRHRDPVILRSREDAIQYVSAQLVFKDGTSSDVKISRRYNVK